MCDGALSIHDTFAAMLPIRLHKKFLCILILAAHVASSAAAAVLDGMRNAGQTGGMCMPAVTAPPCAQGDATGLASTEPTLNLGIGNPVHLATGAKHQMDVDLPASLAHPDLEVVRHYNSLRPTDAALGTGWKLSYDVRVVLHQGIAHIEQANGARVVFDRSSDPRRDGTLQRQPSGWQWVWPNGRILDFDAQGHLIRITLQPNGLVTEIARHRGALAPEIAQVRSGAARLQFVYTLEQGRARLMAIDSPAGRFTYQLEAVPDTALDMVAQTSEDAIRKPDSVSTRAATFAMRLVAVTRPDGMQRQYLYEAAYQSGNAALPTGVVLVQPADDRDRQAQRLRISAWDYDASGRAVGVSYGARTVKDNYSRIHYLRTASATRDGVTLVDGPTGQTRFTITLRGGQPRLRAVEGAACPGCAAPGIKASYDAQGRLLSVNDTRITRDVSGRPIALEPQAPGWPGLRMTFSATGMRRQWQSTLTGTETMQDHVATRTAVRQFANGDRMDVLYDVRDRPVRIRESRGSPQAASKRDAITTNLQWRDAHLSCLQHPFATEVYRYDVNGRLSGRTEMRRLSAAAAQAGDAAVSCDAAIATQPPDVWRFSESFQYDAQGRLTTHMLPEGGAIHYAWGAGDRLETMTWEDASGERHRVITTVENQAGYRYGNGLHLYAAHDGHAQMSLTLLDATGARWRQTRQQNAQGQVLRETVALRTDSTSTAATMQHLSDWHVLEDWRYAYDRQSRLIGAQDATGANVWLAWQPDGALAAMRTASVNTQNALPGTVIADGAIPVTQKPVVARDPSGLPGTFDDFSLRYGANRRLLAVDRHGETLAHYVHNAYGQRIRTESANTRTDYLYLGNRLVAQTRPVSGSARAMIARRYLYAYHVPVGMIVYDDGGRGELYAIHADLLGAPRMITDTHAAVRWLAVYTPLGAARRVAGDMVLHMRLPGQWFDPATKLHDNLLRTYAPQWGQYLEPDPLGPIPENQALGYAAQQPRRFVDPMGLLLFAFDGTRHSQRTNSNVMKFLQQYQDGPAYYHSGPGNSYTQDWDAVTAYSAPRILQTQWLNLLVALKQANTSSWMRDARTGAIPIDIIGFSRGAALGRHFGNLIARQTSHGLFSYQHADLGLISACVDLRFMGLLDTVAQFGLNGVKNRDYDLGIAQVWRWVAHAVALHEQRLLFPLSSTRDSQNTHVVEAPFIGAHADIGGGNLLDPNDTPRRGDLSNVALNWLWWQAQAAGVDLSPLTRADHRVQEPLMHDMRSTSMRLIDADRVLLNARGINFGRPQGEDTRLGARTRKAVEPFIHRRTGWRLENDVVVGEVDMHGYGAWLQQELGWSEQGWMHP